MYSLHGILTAAFVGKTFKLVLNSTLEIQQVKLKKIIRNKCLIKTHKLQKSYFL